MNITRKDWELAEEKLSAQTDIHGEPERMFEEFMANSSDSAKRSVIYYIIFCNLCGVRVLLSECCVREVKNTYGEESFAEDFDPIG